VFDVARHRQNLWKFLLRHADDPSTMIKHDRPTGSGALIEGKDVLFPVLRGI
jgi:hypothetical protein